jgi:hypothetical protein
MMLPAACVRNGSASHANMCPASHICTIQTCPSAQLHLSAMLLLLAGLSLHRTPAARLETRSDMHQGYIYTITAF